MILVVHGHSYGHAVQCVAMLFFPLQKIVCQPQLPTTAEEDYIFTSITSVANGGMQVQVQLLLNEQPSSLTQHLPQDSTQQEQELALARLLYQLLAPATGITPPWGILTGVRPVKLLRSLQGQHGSLQAAIGKLEQDYFVSKEKLALALTTCTNEEKILQRSKATSVSLYVSIPFCPTRCQYCSFISHTVGTVAAKIPVYIDLLCKEIAQTGRIIRDLGLTLETVYFGGGTPTALEPQQLQQILQAVATAVDLSTVQEYTVEAGRPDTITMEKLQVLRSAGVERISVNPQTFTDAILKTIGRKHTVAQFYQSYEMVQQMGFTTVNVDIIAGLPGDTASGFEHTVQEATGLAPTNITVHTLSVKRAAQLNFNRESVLLGQHYSQVVGMVNHAHQAVAAAGYAPYYLYRQKNMCGNLENTGFAKPGHEGLYNSYIMDETHTIIAVGAGASTKVKHPITGDIQRIFNFKYINEYIQNFAQVQARKEKITQFYTKQQNTVDNCATSMLK